MRRLRRPRIETRGLVLHLLGEFAHRIQPERPVKPDRTPRDKTFHVLAPDEREEVAEFLPMQLEQPVPVSDLFLGHPVVDRRRVRIGRAQAVGE